MAWQNYHELGLALLLSLTLLIMILFHVFGKHHGAWNVAFDLTAFQVFEIRQQELVELVEYGGVCNVSPGRPGFKFPSQFPLSCTKVHNISTASSQISGTCSKNHLHWKQWGMGALLGTIELNPMAQIFETWRGFREWYQQLGCKFGAPSKIS